MRENLTITMMRRSVLRLLEMESKLRRKNYNKKYFLPVSGWNDQSCSEEHRYVCQLDLENIPTLVEDE